MPLERIRLSHGFGPFIRSDSHVLILGSFPSVKSREAQFYYGHPQNRFWAVLAALCGEETPQSRDEKEGMLSRHGIALYDVIESCTIVGSSDRGYALPKGVDPAIREVLYNALVEAINDPDTIKQLEDIGAATNFVPQEEYAAFIEKNIETAKAAYGIE